jgi:hypothetical protein
VVFLPVAQSWADVGRSLPNVLPRGTPATRDLQTAHNFASGHRDYLGFMQGFALLCISLLLRSSVDRQLSAMKEE